MVARAVMDTGSASCSVQGPGRAVSCATSRSSLICTCAPCVGVVSPPVARVCRASRCICWGWDAFSRASPSSVSVACARVPERPACTARSCTAVEPPPSSLPGGSDRSSSGVESLACSSKVALSDGGVPPARLALGDVLSLVVAVAACSCRAAVCQPPFHRAFSCAAPLAVAPCKASCKRVPTSGRLASQRWVWSTSVHCTCRSPVPAWGARLPWARAVAPGTVSAIWPWPDRSPGATRRLVASMRACRASSSRRSSCKVPPGWVGDGGCQLPWVVSVLMRSKAGRLVGVLPEAAVPVARISAVKRTTSPCICAPTRPASGAAAQAVCRASGRRLRSSAWPSSAPVVGV